jgi:hypothetical protein
LSGSVGQVKMEVLRLLHSPLVASTALALPPLLIATTDSETRVRSQVTAEGLLVASDTPVVYQLSLASRSGGGVLPTPGPPLIMIGPPRSRTARRRW